MDLNADTFKPFNIIEEDVASEKEKFGKTIGTFLPYLFLIFCFSGALYPALDMGAGEKERGTLETILTSPALRIEIMLGKFIVVAIFGIMSAIFGLLGLVLAVRSNSDIPAEIIMKATDILKDLDRFQKGKYFFGNKMSLCDVAVFPFVRQFAFINIDWFNAIEWKNLNDWLNYFLDSEIFASCQKKYIKWESGNPTVYFP